MKQAIFLSSAAAAITATAIFLFRHGRKKHPPIMTFRDLYEDNAVDNGIYDWE